ncbi:ATP synthase F1 subunit gamma [bacterium CG10_46_32]|nr:MAG: ATP synthase F1 subunit gamma [bacterium CG10_46_32]PIR56577.1 MAG: ATP synthase F1 subunit gamma [Parcubacteria group bacterium CG10_big_fil_rev_8_21_14_0_10_46_32]
MGANTKEVKQRLVSVKNTRKITKAMELVAASKMRKAVENTLRTRNYHNLAWGIMDRILSSQLWFNTNSPVKRFFEEPKEVQHTTVIVFTSNRGLAGAFNSNIVKQVIPHIKEHGKEAVEIITIGAKGASMLSSFGATIALAYQKNDTAADDSSIRQAAEHVYHAFRNKKTDRVMVAYTDYKNAMTQNAVIKQLYPFTRETQVGIDTNGKKHEQEKNIEAPKNLEYLYEPSKYDLLDYLALRIAQAEVYQALLESNASEHASRMIAMKNASDSARDMADALQLEYNKARQAAITQEIAEISAGATAVS